MSTMLEEARNYIKNHHAENRLSYHITADIGWLNDPNGLVYYKGYYHLFYQNDPYETKNTRIFWAHLRSKDLIRWESCPTALAPDQDYDRDGCYTGSAVVQGEKLILLYTGHKNLENGYQETQNIAVSLDGIHFEKYDGNPVIADVPENTTCRFRDPKVWKHGENYYVVIGAQDENGYGKVVLYRSEDMKNFKYEGVLADSDGSLGTMWECPNFITCGEENVLIFSPKGLPKGERFDASFESGYMTGTLDYETKEFRHGEYRKLDYGYDFYAPQVLTKDGRNILFAWMSIPEEDKEEKKYGWIHNLTIPREVTVDESGKVHMNPVEELKELREKVVLDENICLNGETELGCLGNKVEFCCDYHTGGDEKTGIVLYSGEEELLRVCYDKEEIVLQKAGRTDIRKAETGRLDTFSIRAYVDESAVEIYVNDGAYVFSVRCYPKEAVRYAVYGEGEACVKAYQMKRIFS